VGCGAESWTCTKKEESKIQAMEMKFLRENLGKTRRHKIRNNDIREQLKVDDIKHDMERNRLKWYGHVMCMADERIPKKMLQMKLRGRTPRGRPRARWMDQVKRDVEKRWKKWMQLQPDR
jgi:CRISPR/Cas system CSM-associated protein Csm5 (group 7 of RAMP superfamily)